MKFATKKRALRTTLNTLLAGLALGAFAAQAAGTNAGATEASTVVVAAAARSAAAPDIGYYTARFDGGALQFSKAGCVRPAFPSFSANNEDITRVSGRVKRWADCYNDYVAKVAASLPIGRLIPADARAAMSVQEQARAQLHMDQVLAVIVRDAGRMATEVNAETDAWKSATETYVAGVNTRSELALAEVQVLQRKRAN